MWAKFLGWVRFLFDLFEDMQDLRDEQARLKNQLELLRDQQEQSPKKFATWLMDSFICATTTNTSARRCCSS